MRIEYRLTFGDYMLFNAMHQLLSVPLQLLYLLFAGMIYLMSIEDSGMFGAAMAALIAYVFMWLFQFIFNVLYTYSRKNKALLTRHVVEVQDDAFYEETEFGRSFHYWPGIAKVVSRPGFAAVYINALAAHIIPRRAFSSDQHLAEFVNTIRERVRASGKGQRSNA